MKYEDLVVGMEVRLRKNINKCTYTNEYGHINTDIDIRQYNGGDVVVIDDTFCIDEGMVWVKKDESDAIKIHPKNLRKIK